LKVVISNGSYKFHLAPLASELYKRGNLSAFFTAGYPKVSSLNYLKSIPVSSFQRLIDRREDMPDDVVYAFNSTEIYFKTGDLFFRSLSPSIHDWLHIYGFNSYAKRASKKLKRLDYDIYHYRNCYGLESVKLAKEAGKKTICDHSIGHPYAIKYILNNNNLSNFDLPELITPQPLELLLAQYYKDFKYADAILVNSDFVKQTFIKSCFPSDQVKVVYLGVDDKFLNVCKVVKKPRRKKIKSILFAGGWSIRKGAHYLMAALQELENEYWELTIAGGIEPELKNETKLFFEKYRSRIRFLGFLSREELCKIMLEHQIFIFPSLMEGSARVVFEALACGCFVLTTPNSGSIVKEGIHGTLLSPGSIYSIVNGLKKVWHGHYDIKQIGDNNMELIFSSYRQDQYTDKVLNVYSKL
jgi:glycosyltransferase involved in cell wall biosynthesis